MVFEFADDCGVRLLRGDGGFAARSGCGSLRLPQAGFASASRREAVHEPLVHGYVARSDTCKACYERSE